MKKLVFFLALALSPFCLAVAQATPVKVEIRGEPGDYTLYRGGREYRIRGAGTQQLEDLPSLARHGGNSLRTWSTDNAGKLLDRAQELGLTVSLCLDVRRERHGFDYDNERAVRAQFRRMKREVMRYRKHPALLSWIIGNELNHDFSNPKVYDAVNDISRMIHELDPNHPTTTTTAGISRSLVAVIAERAPDLDFLSVQVYGGLKTLKRELESIDYEKPMMVTEWGTVGHWEVEKTAWGAPLELHSSAKAQHYLQGYKTTIQPMSGRLIGDYVFLWGQKQERTPTWYGMFTRGGLRTEAVDVMQHVWTGDWPQNRTPQMFGITLNNLTADRNVTLAAGETHVATVRTRDLEGDRQVHRWQLMRESTATQSGGDPEEVPEDLSHLIENTAAEQTEITAPDEPGAYRLFVYVTDQGMGVAHANLPFLVTRKN